MKVRIGGVEIGGGAPVSIQSMTDTDTRDASATTAGIRALSAAGCEIVRVAVPDEAAAAALTEILSESPLPVVADIHFDHTLALSAIAAGVHGVRINPGNIGGRGNVRAVAEAAGEAGIPIRVGANSGSLPKGLLEKCSAEVALESDAMALALVEAASAEVELLDEFGFRDVKVSLKSSDAVVTVKANRVFSERFPNPLHLGVTEAGLPERGVVKSAVGIGSLLVDGIGDTIRVSLTADPVEEIAAAKLILESVGARVPRLEIISCPTCGRKEVDVVGLAERMERALRAADASGDLKSARIAVMGCPVNGPGEAKAADYGVAGTSGGKVVFFEKGRSLGVFTESEAMDRLLAALGRD